MEAETLALAQEMDFSLWGLYARATIIVKLVMWILVIASFWAWSIIIQKIILYRKARADAAAFDRRFWSGEPLDELFDEIGPEPSGRAERIFAAGMMEWRRSHRNDGGLIAGATARIDRSMDVAIAKETEELQSGLQILATIGSTTPRTTRSPGSTSPA
jgi:biopolymer transport protein TolQ